MNDRLFEQAATVINHGVEAVNAGKRALIYVSPIDAVAPLSVPAARRLLYAQSLATMMRMSGYDVFYRGLFADGHHALQTLTVSIWLRYLELCGEAAPYLPDCYHGDYVFDFAATLHRTYGNRWQVAAEEVTKCVAQRSSSALTVYRRLQEWIGPQALAIITEIGLHSLAGDIANDLRELGIACESWPHSSDLIREGAVANTLALLQEQGLTQGSKDKLYYLPLADVPAIALYTESGPTVFAAQLSDSLQALGDSAEGDLPIYVYDSEHENHIKVLLHSLQRLANTVVIAKPIGPLHLFEQEEAVATSPLEADFVSFREARQVLGLQTLRDRLLDARCEEALAIDLAGTKHVEVQRSDPILQFATTEPLDAKRLQAAWQNLNPENRKPMGEILLAISGYPAIYQQALHSLEPAVLADYHRKLCEKCFSYYNKHQLGVTEIKTPHSPAEKTILTALSAALRRLTA